MTARARIYKPTKTAMQSGRAKTRDWVLEFEPAAAKRADPLMGWIGSPDTDGQVRLRFATREDALAYAARRGIACEVEAEPARTLRPRSYAENFRYDRVR